MRLGAAVVLVLAGASLLQAGVKVDYDTGTDFSKYGSFGWMQGTPAPSELAQKRIERAIESELTTRGVSRAVGDPDLLVVTHASVGKRVRIDADSKALVWRGIATRTLASNPDPEKSQNRINKVVRKLFKKFPPSAE